MSAVVLVTVVAGAVVEVLNDLIELQWQRGQLRQAIGHGPLCPIELPVAEVVLI
jgi:hypothetical protein